MNSKISGICLGSCRVLVVMNHSKFYFYNTFYEQGKREINPKFVIGRGYSLKEHYEMILLILNKKKYIDYIGNEYPDYSDISNNISEIRNNFQNIKVFIIEVCSLKYYTDNNNRLIHNIQNHSKYTENNLLEKDCHFYIEKILELLPDKKILFVNHFLHTKIDNRILINKCLQKYKSENINVVIPSDLWNLETEKNYLSDPNHYKSDKYKDIANYLDNHIIKFYSNYSNKIALCISGYFTNKNNDNLLNSNYIYDNIINNIDMNTNTLDIFIHSFDI